MTTIIQLLNALKYRNDRLEAMLTRLAWPLPGHLGARWLDSIADSFLAGVITDEDVAEIFFDRYRIHGLQDLRREWEQDPLIAPRLPILLDALTAHEEGRYTLSVPVILAQLEGIVAAAREHEGRFTIKTLIKYLELIRTQGSRFQRITAKYVVEILWCDFYHGAEVPELSRHAILHGADVEYGTASNSLRTILYFDNIRVALNALGGDHGDEEGNSHL
ncbi:MAG: hypothetical protein H3C34_18840 [Caldilineaceae bacterium]|nr:hypothetical protein [Caldilineaceae bacterium]